MRSEKAKEKEVAFRDVEETPRLIRSTTTLQPLLTLDPKDKGKGVLVKEEHVIVKRRDQGLAQIESDAELAQRLYEEELAEVEIAQKERQTAQEEASIAVLYEEYDTIQASIDADALFATRLQQEVGKQSTRKKRVEDSALKQKSSKKQKMMQEQESGKSDEDAAADYE
ncbi:hypothetical protein Tco_0288314, partial [Tanacetum coccineum]